jgi:hypothetical protein
MTATAELTMTQRAIEELSTFNDLITTVLPYGQMTVAEDGIGKVEEAHKAVKRLHADIEKKREELKEDSLKYGRTVDSIATQLKSKVKEVEAKLKAERDAHDAVEKAEKAAKEAAKLAAKQARINEMVANGIAIDWVAAEMPEEEWMWWLSKAKKEAAAIAEEKRIAEEFEAKQRKEREELAAKMRAEQEAETKRQAEELRIRAAEIEKQRLADEAILAEQRKAMEAEKAELLRQQEELRKAEIARQAEAEAKAKAEREAAEAARLEALKPEIEKAQGFAECMVTDAMDSLVRLGNPAWGDDAMHIIRNCGSSIVALVVK